METRTVKSKNPAKPNRTYNDWTIGKHQKRSLGAEKIQSNKNTTEMLIISKRLNNFTETQRRTAMMTDKNVTASKKN